MNPPVQLFGLGIFSLGGKNIGHEVQRLGRWGAIRIERIFGGRGILRICRLRRCAGRRQFTPGHPDDRADQNQSIPIIHDDPA